MFFFLLLFSPPSGCSIAFRLFLWNLSNFVCCLNDDEANTKRRNLSIAHEIECTPTEKKARRIKDDWYALAWKIADVINLKWERNDSNKCSRFSSLFSSHSFQMNRFQISIQSKWNCCTFSFALEQRHLSMVSHFVDFFREKSRKLVVRNWTKSSKFSLLAS